MIVLHINICSCCNFVNTLKAAGSLEFCTVWSGVVPHFNHAFVDILSILVLFLLNFPGYSSFPL